LGFLLAHAGTPFSLTPCSFAIGVVERSVAAGGNRRHRSQIGSCAGALVRSRSGANDKAEQMVVLRQDKTAKILARLLVPHPAVAVLQAEHLIEIPSGSQRELGSFPPDSGILRSRLRTAPLSISQVHTSVPVDMPEFTHIGHNRRHRANRHGSCRAALSRAGVKLCV
jgi:hypothetical protein